MSNPARYRGDVYNLYGSYSDDLNVNAIPLGSIKFGVQSDMDDTVYNRLDLDALDALEPHPGLGGEWTGYCFNSGQTDTAGLMQIFITNVDANGNFHGRGRDIHSTFSIHGHKDVHQMDLEMTFVREADDLDGGNVPTSCKANLDAFRERIAGKWGVDGIQKKGDVCLCKTPASLHRFRHLDRKYDVNLAYSRWSFATRAVLFQVHQRLWSWRFFEGRFTERRRFIELYCRQYLSNRPEALNKRELAELKTLQRCLHPADVHFYRSIARSQFKPCLHMYVGVIPL